MKKLYQLPRTGRKLLNMDLKSILVVGLLSVAAVPAQDVLAKGYAYQQVKVVSGIVTDEEGVAMPGVNVLEKVPTTERLLIRMAITDLT